MACGTLYARGNPGVISSRRAEGDHGSDRTKNDFEVRKYDRGWDRVRLKCERKLHFFKIGLALKLRKNTT